MSLLDVVYAALPRLSLALIKIVCGYLVSAEGATPKLLLTIATKSSGGGHFSDACTGVAVSPVDGKIWVASSAKVQAFSGDGKFLHLAANRRWDDANGVAFAASGDAFVVDRRGHCISVCRPDGSFWRQIGTYGSRNGLFDHPHYLAVDTKQGLLFVTDSGNSRVQVLKLDGSFVRAFGSYGGGDGQFLSARGIVLSAAGEVAVADMNSVQVFDCNGKFLRKFGSKGTAIGQFKSPHGLAVDSAGNWLVCDYLNHRVQMFLADGSVITAFGDHNQIKFPLGICVDRDGRILVGDGSSPKYRVQVFAFS